MPPVGPYGSVVIAPSRVNRKKRIPLFPSRAGIIDLRQPTVSDEVPEGCADATPGRARFRGILRGSEGVNAKNVRSKILIFPPVHSIAMHARYSTVKEFNSAFQKRKWLMKEMLRSAIRAIGYDIRKRDDSESKELFNPSRATVSTVSFDGNESLFFVENPTDAIQRFHAKGKYYEEEDLRLIGKHYDASGTFVDVGANVGNHSIFAAKALGAPRVIAFEPVLKQHSIMAVNIALNDLNKVIELRKFGLSDQLAKARMEAAWADNIGGASISPLDRGEVVNLRRGDDELENERVSFIKIDVECHELEVLNGLVGTIEKHSPHLYVEVDTKNTQAVQSWIETVGYSVCERIKHYETNENLLLVPAS